MADQTNFEKQHERLKNDPAYAAKIGAKGGRAKKGKRNLSTIIRNIGEDIDWSKTTLKDKESLEGIYGNQAWEALTYVAFTQAISGDSKARMWLSKNAFGDKLVHEFEEGFFEKSKLTIEIIEPKHAREVDDSEE